MQTNQHSYQILRKGLRIVLISIVLVAGIFVGFFVGGSIGNLISANRTQSDLTWQSLGTPPDKPIKLLGLCKSEICVETRNGQQYRYNSTTCNRSAKQPCWQTDSSKVIEPIIPQLYGSCTNSMELPVPPMETIQLLGAKICGSEGDGYIYYALLDDGSVWKWEHWLSVKGFIDMLFSAIFGAFIGFASGIIILIFVFRRARPRVNLTTEQIQT